MKGFTLIEALVTIAIAGILIALGLPSFTTLIKDRRLQGHQEAFLGALVEARSTALARQRRTVLCASADGASCAASGSENWSSGWIVFVDNDADLVRDNGEELVLVGGAAPPSVTLDTTLSTALTPLSFDSMGHSAASRQFVWCDDRGTSKCRNLNVMVTGMIRKS